jgi:hypothetical protein
MTRETLRERCGQLWTARTDTRSGKNCFNLRQLHITPSCRTHKSWRGGWRAPTSIPWLMSVSTKVSLVAVDVNLKVRPDFVVKQRLNGRERFSRQKLHVGRLFEVHSVRVSSACRMKSIHVLRFSSPSNGSPLQGLDFCSTSSLRRFCADEGLMASRAALTSYLLGTVSSFNGLFFLVSPAHFLYLCVSHQMTFCGSTRVRSGG